MTRASLILGREWGNHAKILGERFKIAANWNGGRGNAFDHGLRMKRMKGGNLSVISVSSVVSNNPRSHGILRGGEALNAVDAPRTGGQAASGTRSLSLDAWCFLKGILALSPEDMPMACPDTGGCQQVWTLLQAGLGYVARVFYRSLFDVSVRRDLAVFIAAEMAANGD